MAVPSNSIITLDYRSQILGCWQGKAVGGTLGGPLAGRDGPFDLSYYDPAPSEILPNDALNLQVLWACVLEAMERPAVDRMVLGQAWLDHVRFPRDEFGVAARNLGYGLKPPHSGSHDNWFSCGAGAAIRSELWACLAPGDADLATAYAYEDACVDHAGEGIWAEVFWAGLQSLAFVEPDCEKLFDAALEHLPEKSELRAALAQTRSWWRQLKDWRAVRENILNEYGSENFTDVVMNTAFAVLGWLAGEDDLSRSICIAVNCGKDAGYTGAALGALMGIIDPKCIGENWLEPIGRRLVPGDQIVGVNPPATLDEFTDMLIGLRERLEGRRPPERPVPPQSPARLEIPARIAFLDRMPAGGLSPPMPDHATDFPMSGTWTKWNPRLMRGNVLLVEYPFHLDRRQAVRVMFDSRCACRVWIDEGHAFSHEGGVMCPSFHRAPVGHFRDMNLAQGEHILRVAVARPDQGQEMEWVVGIGDAHTHQWLGEALLRQSGRQGRFNSHWRQ